MRAAVFLKPGKPLIVEDVAPRAPGPRDVVVRVTASGVCRSDLSVVDGVLPAHPLILGHEGTGVVEEVGPEVRRVAVGDRVVGTFIPACGECWFCRHHESHLCEETFPVMLPGRATRTTGEELTGFCGLGTFAERMTVSEISLVRVESDLPDEQLALLGCAVTTGVGAVRNTAGVEAGSSVVVVGCGGVGQSVVQGARMAGAERIVAIDPVEAKRVAALALGATDVIDPSAEDPVSIVRSLTDGRGADYAFEAIGRDDTLRQAFGCSRRGGTVVAVGVHEIGGDITLPSFHLVLEERRVLGTVYGSSQVRTDIPRLIRDAEAGRLDLGSLVTRTLALDDVNDAMRALRAGEVIRSVIL